METFDLIVIGAGPGGYVAAIRAAQLGMRVACIEKRKTYGGTCLNVGCIPSKALLDSSELYEVTQHKLAKHGIGVSNVTLDLAAMMKRKDHVVKGLTDGVAYLFKKNKVTGFQGSAKLLGSSKVEISHPDGTKRTIIGSKILLATGSEVSQVPSLPFDGQNIISSTEALCLDKVPEHLIVVGGGYIGLEMGSVWLRLGSKVTVLEFLPRILPLTDTEIATMAHKSLAKQGMQFHLETKVTGAKVANGKVTVSAEGKEGPLSFEGDKVLVCVGRRPNIEGLGLAEVGVQYDPKSNKVPVNDHYETNVAGIYAIGDLIAGPMLAHKAQEEGVAVAELMAGKAGHVNYDCIPSVIYIWPEVASVGPTEEQIKESGRQYKVGKFPFAANGRAKAMDEAEGVVKVITDAQTDRLLAVHIFGPRASDMIAEAVTTMEFKGSAEDIARIVHSHPTLSEAMGEAARMAYSGLALHS
ncbi:dihydrolipoyl dehydrogenase [Telmatocola sphagniphila]|uniref:Dihydrolipoyl dehydrogenase n=1 Tax=Telmatocola sphagniphila TaxID=1123043 RepID=A0A8E6B7S9_9BACT|nr:dihydrolipoyl dehydrogenase [Telmatocola sphagniphila]QVL31985.1 dihydrolipoyl dehydrogenase [Telmatocola sphagniphila]